MGMGDMAGSRAGTWCSQPPAKLTDRDVSIVLGTPGVTEVYPEITLGYPGQLQGREQDHDRERHRPPVRGASRQVDKGRYLSPSDKYSVVLGSQVANGTFGREIRTGSYITITNMYNGKSQDYVVAGVMKERNASILVGNPNTAIYMTKAGLKALSDQDTYSYIGVRADSVQSADSVAKDVERRSAVHRNEGFSVLTQKMFADMITQVFA